MANIFDSITKYAVGNKANEGAYEDMREVASSIHGEEYTAEEMVGAFDAACEAGESDFMETNYGHDENAIHKSGKSKGKWKYRTYLPRAYSTAKSAVRKGLAAGIDPSDKGKTALEKETKAATRVPKSERERIEGALNTLITLINRVENDTERADYIFNARVKFNSLK